MSTERWGWEYRDTRLPPPVPSPETPAPLAVPLPLGTADAVEQAERVSRSRTARLTGADRKLRRDADADYREWLAACVEAHGRFELDLSQWSARRAEHAARQLETVPPTPAWVPLRPLTTERVDVFGGTARGWERLLETVGRSLIEQGVQLTVLDVSQRHVSRPLGRALAEAGVAARGLTLPEQLRHVDLLAGLSASDVGGVLAEAIDAADPAPRGAPDDADDDARLIARQAAAVSGDRVTFARLRERLGEPDGPRAQRIASALERLAALDASTGTAAPLGSGGFALRVIELSGRAPEAARDLLRHLLAHVTLARLRVEPNVAGRHDQVLVVAGAERLRQADVAQLDALARGRGTRLVLLFAALREWMLQPTGGSRAAVMMRLEDASAAELAARATGRSRFAVAPFTAARGDVPPIASRGEPPRPTDPDHDRLFDTPPRTRAEATGEDADPDEERATALAYELGPTLLQGLSPTALILLDPQDPGSPRLGDCDPTAPRSGSG